MDFWDLEKHLGSFLAKYSRESLSLENREMFSGAGSQFLKEL